MLVSHDLGFAAELSDRLLLMAAGAAVRVGPPETVMDEAVLSKERRWEEWTARTRMTSEARAALESLVRAAPSARREAFHFRIDGDRIEAFTDRMILLRADRD